MDFEIPDLRKESLQGDTLWRYRAVLPDCKPVTLGEGGTPLLPVDSLGTNWFIKDESLNPTGSFKARGMSVGVSMAKKFGFEAVAVPSAGNAGGAMAAYAAKAGMAAHVFVPVDTPKLNITECNFFGAILYLVNGLITDCALEMREKLSRELGKTIFDMSTLREPYRVEGKKTMGYEIAEQMNWRLPDVILYPTGGGTGLIGLWKAFDEMERLGWVDSRRPRMVCVQAEGCCPIVRAFEKGDRFAAEHENPTTKVWGLRVPKALGDFIMLDILRESNGTAIAVSDEDIHEAASEMAGKTGVFASPEGGATLAAANKLRDAKWIKEGESAVLFNTASGLKYL